MSFRNPKQQRRFQKTSAYRAPAEVISVVGPAPPEPIFSRSTAGYCAQVSENSLDSKF